MTPGLRKRRERAERQRRAANGEQNGNPVITGPHHKQQDSGISLEGPIIGSGQHDTCMDYQNNAKNAKQNGRPWMLPIYTNANGLASSCPDDNEDMGNDGEIENDEEMNERELMQLKRENTVKDLTQKLTSQNLISNAVDENRSVMRNEELSGMYQINSSLDFG